MYELQEDILYFNIELINDLKEENFSAMIMVTTKNSEPDTENLTLLNLIAQLIVEILIN